MSNSSSEYSSKLLAAVTFHFRETRLPYLFQVVRSLADFPVERVDVVVITNVDDDVRLGQINELCQPLFEFLPAQTETTRALSIESFTNLSNPWHLPWSHKHLIPDIFLEKNSNYTHFAYMEEDVLLSFSNFRYFLYFRDKLKPHGLIPSFQRVEYNSSENRLYFVDQIGVSKFKGRNHVDLDGYEFVNLDYPHNAMYILDRDLALEYVNSPSFDRETSRQVRADWAVCERSAMGLCFENIPPGFSQRYVSPVNPKTLTTPSWSWVYHIANNYVLDKYKPFSKTRVDQLFGEAEALSWRPPPKLAEYVHRARRRITKAPTPAGME